MTTKTPADVIKIGHIGNLEIIFMLIFLLTSNIFHTFPVSLIKSAGSSAWISVIISTIPAVAGTAGWILWMKDTQEPGFVPGLRNTAGRVLGDLIAFALIAFFAMKISLNTRMFGGGAVIGLLPRFPLEVLLATIIIPSIYAAWFGLEAVSRLTVLFIPLIGISVAVVLLSSYRLWDFRHMLPLWGLGHTETLLTGLANVRLWGGISVIIVFKSYVKQAAVSPGNFKGIAISAIVLVVVTVAITSIFPYPQSTFQVIPLGIVARSTKFRDFWNESNPILFHLVFAILIQSSITYIGIFITFAQLTNTKTYRPIVPAVGLLGIRAVRITSRISTLQPRSSPHLCF